MQLMDHSLNAFPHLQAYCISIYVSVKSTIALCTVTVEAMWYFEAAVDGRSSVFLWLGKDS